MQNVDAAVTTDRVLEWLDSFAGERPLFLWIHYWDTHEPNEPAAAFGELFQRDAELDAWIEARGIVPARLLERNLENA